MRQSPRVGDRGFGPRHRLLRKAQTEQRQTQECLRHQRMRTGLMHQRGMGGRIIQRKQRLEMRSRTLELPSQHKALSGGAMTQHHSCRIAPRAAQVQQFLPHTPRLIEFPAIDVAHRLPVRHVTKRRRRPQMLPKRPRSGISLAGFPRRLTFDEPQQRAQSAAKIQLLPQAFWGFRQQVQLIQRFLILRRRLGQRRTGRRPLAGPGPGGDRLFHQPSLGVMLRKQLRVCLHQLRRLRLKRVGNTSMQMLPTLTQQAAIRRHPAPARA